MRSPSFVKSIFISILMVAAAASFADTPSPTPKKPDVAMILSTGDNLFYYKWFPIDSSRAMGSSFDAFMSLYNVNRIIWRRAQAQWMTDGAVFRPQSEEIDDLYRMEMNLETRDHLTRVAAAETKKRGLAFWGFMPLFEVGASADVTSMSGFGPYNFEDRFRADHPEYRLSDRAGIETGGPLEFGYPEVRRDYLRRYEEKFQPGGDFSQYDGIIFYTYVENFFPRFTDQFIYSDIAARDFKRRYGVDVYSQPFDMDKYMEMRGEYITQYLREMRQLFNKYGKKIAFYIDTQDPEVPMHWPSYRQVLTPGRIKMDWRTWVKEGLVDELALRDAASINDIQPFIDATRGTKTRLGIAGGEMPQFVQNISDQDFSWHIWSPEMPPNFPVENSPVSALEGSDPVAKMSVLRQVRDGSIDVPVAQVVQLLNDRDQIVRHMAVDALVRRRVTAAIPAMESAAMDPENNFRCNVIDALGTMHGPNTVAAIGKALEAYPVAGMRIAARSAWAAMFPADSDDLIALYYRTTSPYVRTAIVEMIVSKRAVPAIKATAAFRPLVDQAAADPNDTLRSIAAFATAYYPDSKTAQLLLHLLDDPSEVVQDAAAFSCGEVARDLDDRKLREAIFQRLLEQEKLYGMDGNRHDQQWGYRVVAESLIFGFGPRGQQHVVDVLNGPDPRLADLAWRVLFHPDDGWNFYPIDRRQGEALYAYHPGPNRMNVPTQKYELPEDVELLNQNFARLEPDATGAAGSLWNTGGKWIGLNSNVRTAGENGKPSIELRTDDAGRGAQLIGTIAYDMPDGRFKNRLRGHFPRSSAEYGVADGIVELSFDVLKSNAGDSIELALGSDTSTAQSVGVIIAKDGQVQAEVNQKNPGSSVSSMTVSAKDGWQHFVLRLDFSAGKASLQEGDGSAAAEFSFDTDPHYRAIILEALGNPNTETQVADLRLTQRIE